MTPDEKPPANWSSLIGAAVSDFAAVLNETTRELAGAAERFAAEALRVLEDAAEKARAAAATSSEMATAASQAAAEARQAASGLSAVAGEVTREANAAVELVNKATAAAIERMHEEAQSLGEQLMAEVRHQAQANFEQLRASMGQDGMHSAVTEADARAHPDEGAAPAMAAGIQQLLERLENDYELIARLVRDLHERVSSLATPAPPQAPPVVASTPEAHVEMSENQEPWVSTREVVAEDPGHTSVSGPEPWPPMHREHELFRSQEPAANEPEAEAVTIGDGMVEPWSQPFMAQSAVVEPAPELFSAEPAIAPSSEPAPASSEAEPWSQAVAEGEPAQPGMASAAPVETAAAPMDGAPPPRVAGRLLVTIAPVPDFDRLLNLDGALGRMHGIANVSLADYAKEEVTFRIELEDPMTADDFARSLSESAGSPASVARAEEGKLALRLVV